MHSNKTTRKTRRFLSDISEVKSKNTVCYGLAVNSRKTKNMEHIKIGSNSYEKVKTFKFLGSLLTNQFSMHSYKITHETQRFLSDVSEDKGKLSRMACVRRTSKEESC